MYIMIESWLVTRNNLYYSPGISNIEPATVEDIEHIVSYYTQEEQLKHALSCSCGKQIRVFKADELKYSTKTEVILS